MPQADTPPSAGPPFDLREAFLRRQNALAASLGVTILFTAHGPTIGDATEADWVAMLRSVLPARYGVASLFAVDSTGSISDQIDVAVYDRQYSPLFFATPSGVLIVPVESVYAVFEVKQDISKEHLEYAGAKAASVRRLLRTSASIHSIGGVTPGVDPATKPILAGIIAAKAGYTNLQGGPAVAALTGLTGDSRLDLGLGLDQAAFDNTADGLTFSDPGTQLIYFVLHLFRRLQPLATALSPDIGAYEAALTDGTPGAP